MERKAADCAIQHIKVFRQQALEHREADFGEPCAKCPYSSECNYSFFEQIEPILKNTDKVKMTAIICSH